MSAQERNPRVIAEFKQRQKRQLMVSLPLVAVIVLVAILKDNLQQVIPGLPSQSVPILFVAVVVGALLFSFQNWRCPACHRYLGKAFNPQFCSGCGAPLQ